MKDERKIRLDNLKGLTDPLQAQILTEEISKTVQIQLSLPFINESHTVSVKIMNLIGAASYERVAQLVNLFPLSIQ